MKNLFKLLFIVLFLSSCNKKILSCKGTPVADCICTQQYDPVCGCDGVTYSNACEAKCAGVKFFTPGKCQ